jgi:hypothetical protein
MEMYNFRNVAMLLGFPVVLLELMLYKLSHKSRAIRELGYLAKYGKM